MIVWNHGDLSIFIVTEWEPRFSDPAHPRTTTCIAPGDGIDLALLKLKPCRPVHKPALRVLNIND